MISLRAQLLWWLLPGFVVVCVLAGLGVYFTAQREQNAALDQSLLELAETVRRQAVPGGMGGDPGRGPGGRRGGARPDFDPMANEWLAEPEERSLSLELAEGQFVQVLGREGETLERFPDTGEWTLPQPQKIKELRMTYDGVMSSGEAVRVLVERDVRPGPPAEGMVLLGVNRAAVDAGLSRLVGQLVVGGLMCCLALGGVLGLALRMALRPLRKLGEQAEGMSAASLHERFSETQVPADIRPIVERLNILMARLEESFRRERRFSGDLAHELRTPLAAIRTTSEVALKWPDQATAEDFEEIVKISTGLQETVDSLLLLARMESSGEESVDERIRLAGLVWECAGLFSEKVRERQLTLQVELDETLIVAVNPRLLRMVLTNLIGNAVEYAPIGGTVEIVDGVEGVLLAVKNEAPLLEAADVPHLFERLWRKDAVRTESNHAGLGLSIAQACAAVMGFSLCAELQEGVFSLSLVGTSSFLNRSTG